MGANLLFYVRPQEIAAIGGIDEFTKLIMHMDGDFSSSGHDIEFRGTPDLFIPGNSPVGDSNVYFNMGEYILLPSSSDFDFDPSGTWAIDFWFNHGFTAGGGNMIPMINFCGQTNKVGIGGGYNDTTKLSYWMGTGGADIPVKYNIGSGIVRYVWYHVALTCDSGTVRLFLDGNLITGGLDSTIYYDAGNYLAKGSASYTEYYGNLDEIRVSQGHARWTSNFTPETTRYTVDEYTKFLWHPEGDASDSEHLITMVGDANLDSTTYKFSPSSMYFDGVGDYVSIADHDDWNFGSEDFTIDFWVRWPSVPVGQEFFFNQRVDGTHVHEFSLNSGNLNWAVWNGGALFNFSRSVSLSDDTWYHIALVRYGTSMRIYLDGQLLSPDQAFGGVMPDFASVLDIGRWSGGGLYLTAYMDELRISKGIARWTTDFTPETGPYTT